MTAVAANAELHIASFVVQHRPEAALAMTAKIRESGDMELARAGEFRSIVLCECENQYAILDRIDALRAVPGVLNVALVYHHAEPREALKSPMPVAPALDANDHGVAP
ncbi:chaperone NapD [Lysobacter niastensis]|uniref:Chaperone NapD n=1 Tax=Lysobacter niastensis TaxID=380629 RepID=A0ABS0B2G7_9GAMM|nr:chaperone NapD [Lysobacter niastensis]MBF6022472.1 chaperone NapD [Lysobacter niastensis]